MIDRRRSGGSNSVSPSNSQQTERIDRLERKKSRVNTHEQDVLEIREWLDVEVKSRLVALDGRLDSLHSMVGNCLDRIDRMVPHSQHRISSRDFVTHMSRGGGSSSHDALPEEMFGKKGSVLPSEMFSGSPRQPSGRNDSGRSLFEAAAGLGDAEEATASPSEVAPLLLGPSTREAQKSPGLDGLAGLRKTRGRSRWVEIVTNFMDDPDSSEAACYYHQIRTFIILIGVFVTFLQSLKEPPLHGIYAAVIETLFDMLFCVELLVRFVFSPNPSKFLFDIYNLLDILSVAPLAVRAAIGFVLLTSEAETTSTYVLICGVPVIRLLKLLRGFHQIHLLSKAFRLAFEALPVLIFTLVVITFTFSSLIYIVEPRDNIDCLPKAIWLCIVTMTTVGYGDLTPVSGPGYVIIAILVISSVLYMAMPLGIIGYSFTQIWKDRDRILLTQRTRDRLIQWGYSALDIRKVFAHFDSDGGGELDLEEFREMMRAMQIGLSEERIIELFLSFDADGGGAVDEKEFVRGLFPGEYAEIYADERRSGHGSERSKSSMP